MHRGIVVLSAIVLFITGLYVLFVSLPFVDFHNPTATFHALVQENVKASEEQNRYPSTEIYEIEKWRRFEVNHNNTNEDTGLKYHRAVNRVTVQCLNRIRLGSFNDGGWDMCVSYPYEPARNNCLVYSFGIGNNWSFDDAVEKEFHCIIRAFDPTLTNYQKPFIRSDSIYFYPIGISGTNSEADLGKLKNCTFKTLGTIRKQLGDEKKVIDYLKMDVEGSEWSALQTMFTEGFLPKYVKQIGIEFHGMQDQTDQHINILNELEEIGFRKWNVHWNMHCARRMESGTRVSECYEVYYVNIDFLMKS